MLAYAATDGIDYQHTLMIGTNDLRMDGGFVCDDTRHLHSLIAAGRNVTVVRVLIDAAARAAVVA
jgi:hypothetical protein